MFITLLKNILFIAIIPALFGVSGAAIYNNGDLAGATKLFPTQGGTGQSSYRKGDILYSDDTNSLAKLASGSTGQVLKISSGIPGWGTDSTSAGGDTTNSNIAFVTVGNTSSLSFERALAGTGSEVTLTDNGVNSNLVISLHSDIARDSELSLTASRTNWDNFYQTPSGVITAGDNISWSTNTLNVTAHTTDTNTTNSNIPFFTLGNTSSLSFERSLVGTANEIVLTDNGADSTGVLSLHADIARDTELSSVASRSNWESFYQTPSSVISAGTSLSWSGNTLNYDGNHPAVTLAGTPNYITRANQVLTLAKLDISDDTNLTTGATGLTLTANDIDWSDGYGPILTASISAYEGFYDTPSGRITAGTNLSWSGNTLNSTGGGGGGALAMREGYSAGFTNIGSLSFNAPHFNLAINGILASLSLDWGLGGPASLSQDETVTGLWTFSGGASVSTNFEVSGTASISNIIVPTGTVSIGTTSTINPLNVRGAIGYGVTGSAVYPGVKLETSSGDAYFSNLSARAIIFRINSTNERMRISSTGLVGIGTSSPNRTLTVAGTASISGDVWLDSNASVSGGFELTGLGQFGAITADGVLNFGGATSLEIPNGANPTVDAAGEIAIDESGPGQIVYYASSSVIVLGHELKVGGSIGSTSFALWSSKSLGYQFRGGTVTQCTCKAKTATSIVLNLSRNGTTDMDSLTCGTTRVFDDGSIANATFVKGDTLILEKGTVTGEVDNVDFTCIYQPTRE